MCTFFFFFVGRNRRVAFGRNGLRWRMLSDIGEWYQRIVKFSFIRFHWQPNCVISTQYAVVGHADRQQWALRCQGSVIADMSWGVSDRSMRVERSSVNTCSAQTAKGLLIKFETWPTVSINAHRWWWPSEWRLGVDGWDRCVERDLKDGENSAKRCFFKIIYENSFCN